MGVQEDQSDGPAILEKHLRERLPVVAVMGQSSGWEIQRDPVLNVALERVGAAGDDWGSLLTGQSIDPEFYEWLGERFSRRAPSESLQIIGDAPFSAVYTSSIDPGLSALFATGGREPEPILIAESTPRVARSRRRPPIHYLFGRAGSVPSDMKPPASAASVVQRRVRHATAMLRSVAETATSLGLIVIDGYEPASDWLKPADLLVLLSDAPKSGVLWCGPEPEFDDEIAELYSSLLASQVIVRDERSLAHILSYLSANNRGAAEERWDEPEIVTVAEGKRVITTPRLRLATEASATIIDDSWSSFLPPLDRAVEQNRFQAFHGAPSGLRALFEGVRRGFAIKRDFEEDLITRVRRGLAQHNLVEGALIVHGQSGVGKTIALSRLADTVRDGRIGAVLFASGRVPQPTDISGFLEEVDRVDGTTLVISDAMASPRRYDELFAALRSRGHRVVLVGSSYRVDLQDQFSQDRYIEVSTELTEKEGEALVELTEKFSPDARNTVREKIRDPHILAMLYWDLPASRARLAEGLSREARSTETELRSRGRRERQRHSIGILGEALVRAGYGLPTEPLLRADVDSELGSDQDPAVKIIDYVMAVSRLYKAVPINLLLRAIRDEVVDDKGLLDLDLVRELFEGQDLFRWRSPDEKGEDLLVSSRIQLEAQLICDRRLGGPAGEVARIIELMDQAVNAGREGHEETRFLVEIVYALGTDGPFGNRYRDSYADIARALTRLRTQHGVLNARLMLQESTMRRAAVRSPSIGPGEREALLDEASSAINTAFEAMENDGDARLYASRRTRDNLWVERAAIYGFLATDSARRGLPSSEIWSSYLAARSAVRKATGQVDSYFPLDIGLWLPAEILEAGKLDAIGQAELQADIRATMDLVEPGELNYADNEKYQSQRLRLAQLIEDAHLAEDAFSILERAGSTAGFYLKARGLAPDRPAVGELAEKEDVRAALRASEFLASNYESIFGDPRCLQLLLSVQWIVSCRRWMFRGLRQPLPAAESDRASIRKTLLDLATATGDQIQPRYRYLEAILNWLGNDEVASRRSWRALARETEYIESSRVVRRHVVTNELFEPVVFEGIVSQALSEGRWSVLVPSLNRHVDLLQRDFPDAAVERGRTLKNFAIAFNYLGPIADPLTRPRKR